MKANFFVLVSLIILPLFSGCAARQANLRPKIAEHDWHVVSSQHFELTTDLPASQRRTFIKELEQIWWALSDTSTLIIAKQALPKEKFYMVHLASCEDFRAIVWRSSIRGYVASSKDFQRRRTMVTCQDMNSGREVLIHEMTHRFNNDVFSQLPRWLSEGLATYYQTIKVEKGTVSLGKFPSMDSHHWRNPKWLPSLRKLRGFTYAEFQDVPDRRHYFSAWKAVHLLNNSSSDYHKRFRRYLSLLAEGAGDSNAWERSFGDIPPSRLESQYKTYQERTEFKLFRAPYKLRADIGTNSVRKLAVGESHAVWIQLLMTKANGTKDNTVILNDIQSQIELAEQQTPNWAAANFWRAAVAYHFPKKAPNDHDATALLRTFLTKDPTNATARLGLVATQLKALVPEDHTGLGEPVAGLEEMEADVLQLVSVSSSPKELEMIGRYYTLRGQPMTGLNFLRRAIELDAGCASCLETLGLNLYQLGRIDEAISAQESAINLLTESDGVKDVMHHRLAHYRKSLSVSKGLAPTNQD